MSSTRNEDNVQAEVGTGEFHSRVPRSEPLTTHGHQPGQINSEADAAPEFNAKVLLAGTAPTSKTFEPSNEADVPATGVTAADTLGGADSAQVHQGYGHPGSGMSSSEARHDGKSHRASDKSGLEGLQGSNKGNIDTA